MLKAETLTFSYENKQPCVLDNINLTIKPGEVVGLSGDSGKGKTTLAKLLSGYLTPKSGIVTINDRPLPTKGYCPVQMIFQNPELAVNPRWTLSTILTEGGIPEQALLKSLCIDSGWENRYPHELSGGELQRVAVARALDSRTRYLIADEITTMLDGLIQARIWSVVLDYIETTGVGALVISHDHNLLNRICHRIVDMDDLSWPSGHDVETALKKAS